MTLTDFIRMFQVRAPNIMWFLGAGASTAAGIPTANHLIWRFKQMLYCAEQHVPVTACADLGDPALQVRLQQYFDSKERFPKRDSDNEYAYYFETALPNEADRRRYLDNLLASATPSYGHIALAALMKLDKTRIVWTTNFDSLVEDAAAVIFGSTGKLTVSTPDSPHLAADALRDERYPILVKLHGDFRSRRLKNTTEELRAQDVELRRSLVSTSKRFGIAVVGYSGRDHSVMTALQEVIESGKGFPFGFFWFHRTGNSCLDTVLQLVERAKKAGVEAHLIEVDTFDELMADLLLLEPNIPEDTQKHLSRRESKVSDAPMPIIGKGSWPVIRLNALPIITAPKICRRVVCEIGGTKEVRDAVKEAGADIIAGRRKIGVIAFGRDSEIRRVFKPYNISDFGLHTIEPHRLRYESAEHGLLYDALCRALERERPLKICRTRKGCIAAIDPEQQHNSLFQSLKQVIGEICGKVHGSDVCWKEAIRIRIEHRMDRLWLIVEPTVWVEQTDKDDHYYTSREFIRKRLARRYNAEWHKIIDAWANIITGGEKECSLRAFGIGNGCNAVFDISRTTAFSWQEKTS